MPARRVIPTPLCPMTACVNDEGLCLLGFGSPDRVAREEAELEAALGEPCRDADHPLLDLVETELTAYFAGTLKAFTVPLVTPGSGWQRLVWNALRDVPYGETVSYGTLAARLGRPGAARAVGLANGRNRIAVIVPCHRVIASDGTLHGYAGGLDRKRALLDHEALHAGRGLFVRA